MHPPSRPTLARLAFTLIELLVVIAVIALLISIALPVLGQARKSGAQTRETAALRQVGIAYTVYAQDNRSAVLPGFLPLEWTLATADSSIDFKAFSSETSEQSRLFGSLARRYPWRLAPYLNYSREALVVDKRLRAEFGALPDSPDERDGFQWAIAQSPSFGLNSTYVGGDARRGGFYQPSIARWKKYYVTRFDEPLFPDRLLIFATSRGYHPIDDSTIIPGRHRIEGPWQAAAETNQVPTFVPWSAPLGHFDASRTPSTYGHVDYRHFRKALITMFDGHGESVRVDDLRDMRRWSNQATASNWQPR